ncbi:MAG: ABC transporter permease [Bacilli bacterium]|nr:ABC transporter permease [Bacilli bacterium]
MKPAKINFPFRIAKRANITNTKAWIIRGISIVAALLVSGIVCTLFKPGSFLDFYKGLVVGCFGTTNYIFELLCCISIFLLLSIAVTPAFKMKFWNIGVEGQAMIGCILTAVILLLMPSAIPGPLVIIIALLASVTGGMIWAIIPTIFKIRFNTNETLFTLMMNYVATILAAVTIAIVSPGGSQTFPLITDPSRLLINIGTIKYIPFIIVTILFTVMMYFYLRKTKEGFELSVMGDSINTARYVGIKPHWIMFRTMLISGGLAGLCGFLIVCGKEATLSKTLVGGRGFTAVLIAWLGHFNPAEITIFASLVGILEQGATYTAGLIKISSKKYFSGVIIGLFILIVIVSEFFVNYQVRFKSKNKLISNNKPKEAK